MDGPHVLACVLCAARDVVLCEDELGERGGEGAGEVAGGREAEDHSWWRWGGIGTWGDIVGKLEILGCFLSFS